MFEIGEVVAHNKQGLCVIKELTKIYDMNYYVLTSDKDDAKIMIPVDKASNLIRKLINKNEIDELVENIPNMKIELINDFKTRVKKYEELLKSGEPKKLIILLKMIYEYKKEHNNMTVADKEILKGAEKLLFEEFAYVLNIEVNKVEKYIFKKEN